MNKNVLIVLIGGFVIAVLVAVLVQASLGGSKKKEEAPVAQLEILVAAKDLPVGKELTETDIKWQKWPENMAFNGAIVREGDQKPMDVITGRMKQRVALGQPMNSAMVVGTTKDDLLAASLRPGYRAVGVRVSTETIAGGLIGVGDNVDVLMTYKLKRTGNSPLVRTYATETILEDIRVLGINTKSVAQDLEDGQKKSKTKSRLTVTLEVTPEQAEMLALGNEMGDLNLALRSLGDKSIVERDRAKTDVQLSRILTQLVGGAGGGVRIYNGATKTTMQVGGQAFDDAGMDDGTTPEAPPPGEMQDIITPQEVFEEFFNQIEGLSEQQ